MANHYVRAGASGTGSGADWTNAYTALPSTLQRGDTYYLASGSYAAYDCDTPTSTTTLIYIRKATVADHGISTGWSDSYASGQAVFSSAATPLTISTDYWSIDGVTGSLNSGHGIAATVTGTTANARGILITASNVTLSHIEISSTQPENVASDQSQDGVYANGRQNITINSCYIHDWKRCGVLFAGTDLTVSGCYFWHTYSHADKHGQAIQLGGGAVSGATVEKSIFKDCHGTGFIVALDNTHSDIKVRGCVFWATETTPIFGNAGTSQCFGTTAGDVGNNCTFHNNTLVNLDIWQPGRATPGALDFNGAGSGNVAYNNIFYNSTTGFDTITGAYNWFYSSGTFSQTGQQNGTGDPFVDSANGDFRLTAATNAGTTLPSPYDTDITGATRGADGVWDRGAYEYSAGGGEPQTPRRVTGFRLTAI